MNNNLKYVIDTSVSIKQFIPDKLSSKVDQLFDHLENPDTLFYVPELFYIESANALLKYVRSGLYSAEDMINDLASLKHLRLIKISMTDLIEDATNICLEYKVSAYDASYVALSKQKNASLLTLDQRLANTLSNSHYQVINFHDFVFPSL
jgi:predicted nucleic acid-binding protein